MAGDFDFEALERALASATSKLSAGQLVVAHEGRVVFERAFGEAKPETRFWVASATKPFVSAAALLLLDEGALALDRRVADLVPELAATGMQDVTVEQVFLMTCGFPDAPMQSLEGADPDARRARFATWKLQWEPGTRFAYHALSAHWLIADLIERVTDQPFTDFIEERLTRPLGLPRLLGIPREQQTGLVQETHPVDPGSGHVLDVPATLEAGVPGGGMFATAAHIALLYQALLHDPQGLWRPETLHAATREVRCTLPDPVMDLPGNRTLTGAVGKGFGSAWGSSPTAFGWSGWGGQIGFAEPETGISFGFVQAGDPDQISQFVRGMKLAKRALELGR